jgi:putative methylase
MDLNISKKELEIILSKLKPHEQPKPSLEQYTIPSSLAAEILHIARMNGDIEGKRVADLGAGTGRLAIGAAILGAKEVKAIDIDEKSLQTARENLITAEKIMGTEIKVEFLNQDISTFKGNFDTIVQNPPFGIQTEHADRMFIQKALECGKKIYSLHKDGYEKTVDFLTKFIESCGGHVLQIQGFTFDMPHTFKFHSKPKYSYNVDLYIIERK